MQNESFISENQRNHVAVTISDQSQVIFFINNGSPGGEKIPISQPSGILSYYVGVSPDLSPQSFFNGQIDEIMVWNNLAITKFWETLRVFFLKLGFSVFEPIL